MCIFAKILMTQVLIFIITFLSMHPTTIISEWMEDLFGDYEKALNSVMFINVIGIIISLIIWIWSI